MNAKEYENYMPKVLVEELLDKWNDTIELEEAAPITDRRKKEVTAVLLENQDKYAKTSDYKNLTTHLYEASVSGNLGGPYAGAQTGTDRADIQGYDPVMLSLVRRAAPQMIAYDVCGVQPMTGPTGLVFSMRAIYSDANKNANTQSGSSAVEALFDRANTDHSTLATAGATISTEYSITDGSASNVAGLNTFLRSIGVLDSDQFLSADGTGVATTATAITADGAALATAIQARMANSLLPGSYLTGVGTAAGDNVVVTVNAVRGGMDTSAGEYGTFSATHLHPDAGNFREMGFVIESNEVKAQTRQLKAEYSRELKQDLMNVHGLDAKKELADVLSAELLGEINREVVETIYAIAKFGRTDESGTIDLSSTADADGRWRKERYSGLHFLIETDLNGIAIDTRRGKGNLLIVSSNVASALSQAQVLKLGAGDLEHDVTQSTFAGMLGRCKVFIDPFLPEGFDFYCAGYKGSGAFDSGFFYCPYIPFQMLEAQGENTFQPKIAFTTRYGLAANPLQDTTRNVSAIGGNALKMNANLYYRKVKIDNLL